MAEYFQLTDDQMKGCSSRAINKLVSQLQERRGAGLVWDKDVVNLIAEKTGITFPMTTYRSYRAGERVRMPALETIAVAFNVPIAFFLGPERAEQDYQRAINYFENGGGTLQNSCFELPYYDIPNQLAASIPRAMATRLGLRKPDAAAIDVTRDNNGSPTLQIGSLAIIDTSYNSPGMSGDYLIRRFGKPVIANISAGVDKFIKVQMQDNVSEKRISDVVILGRVVGSIG